jgi:hypothetical protein
MNVVVIVLFCLWVHSIYKISSFIKAIQIMKCVILQLADQAGVDGEALIKQMGLEKC